MITYDPGLLGDVTGHVVLDVGSGPGRHTHDLILRGAHACAIDLRHHDLTAALDAVPDLAGYGPITGHPAAVCADATALPFPDGAADVIVCSETLEHVPRDHAVLTELWRVLAPGGRLIVTVPTALPERLCWLLSREYPATPGGHIRIYREPELRAKLAAIGFTVTARTHHHGLHAPYWWLKCLVGVHHNDHPVVTAYHRLLVHDMMNRTTLTGTADRILNRFASKSVALYAHKTATPKLISHRQRPSSTQPTVRATQPAATPPTRQPDDTAEPPTKVESLGTAQSSDTTKPSSTAEPTGSIETPPTPKATP